MFNSVTAAAYLVKDPEVRNTKSGSKVVNLRAGISTANAKTKCFVDIEFWDKTAEIAEKYLSKGRVYGPRRALYVILGERRQKLQQVFH